MRITDLVGSELDDAAREEQRAYIGRALGDYPLLGRISVSGRTAKVSVDDGDDQILPEAARRLGIASLALRRSEQPLTGEGAMPRTLALLGASWSRPHRMSARERLALENAGDLVAVVLAQALIERDGGPRAPLGPVAGRSERDPLTGLLAHTAFEERLVARIALVRGSGTPLSLTLIDIDRFRRVNESHGHDAGDRVLRAVVERVASRARPGDLLARTGGEEISWVTDLPAHDARLLVDRVRAAVARGLEGSPAPVTISSGTCDLSEAGDRDALLRHAAGALYWAKEHGRNRSLAYSSTVVEARSDRERVEILTREQTLKSIRVLARVVDTKDPSTLRHSERVADIAVLLAEQLGWSPPMQDRLREAGLVHDVGKIVVSDAVLFTPGRLSDAEYEEITRHAAVGAKIVADVLDAEQVSWVRAHHERWDGRGYPDGLVGDAIPSGARILAVADAWDVMTSTRPYSRPLSVDDALAECRRCCNDQFAPAVVVALEDLFRCGTAPRGWPSESA